MATTDTLTTAAAPWTGSRTDAEPWYARPALILITAVAALLFAWDIGHSQYHPFYADAVRSMSGNWKAFLYGSFDPGNTITLDKLPGFLWPQALSARLFGFHAWALTLPQAIEGVLSVLVLYRAVRRWAGVNAGLLAAGLLALTPVVAGLFRTSVEDPAFTLLLLLAADATQRAAREARLRSLLLAGVWVGLAFQAKMLEAFAVLPALALVYLVSAPAVLRRRLVHLAVAGAVTLAVSASWILLVTLTPAGDRPYVDGSTDNSAVSMVVGYNFLNRFSAVGMNAADTGSVSAVRGGRTPPARTPAGPAHAAQGRGGGGGGGGAGGYGADGGWTKLVSGPMAAQTGWFYPLALAALGMGLYQRRRTPRTDPLRAGLLLWGSWLGVFFLVLSAGSVGGHTYYLGVIAAPLAALGGAGTVQLWRAHRAGGPAAWALPATVAATAGWGAQLARGHQDFLPLLAPAVLLLGLLSVVVLSLPLLRLPLPRLRRGGTAGARAGLLLGLAAMLVAPAAWTASVLDPAYGHSAMGAVGPSARPVTGHHGQAAEPGSAAFAAAMHASGTLTPSQSALVGYAEAHRQGARYLFATSNWSLASPYILATGAPVLPVGGFTNQAPTPTLGALRQDVGAGALRYVLLDDGRSGFLGRTVKGSAAARLSQWVTSSCDAVPPSAYGGGVAGARLYHCPQQAS